MSLRDRNVQAARRERLARDIASHTGLSLAAVWGRLKRAHGRRLLRNLFADAWPDKATVRASPDEKALKKVAAPIDLEGARDRTVHRVRQTFSTSCGVAVVAMFARVSHEEAMAVLFPNPGRTFYTHLIDLKRALDHFGVRYGPGWRRFRSWSAIPTTSLVKVKFSGDGRTWFHWVIFQRKSDGTWVVIDPDPGRSGTQRLSREETKPYKGITYMPVEAVRPRER